MDGGVAASSPTGAVTEKRAVIDIANVKATTEAGHLHLGVAFEAKIYVTLDEHFGINGTMGAVANGAAFPHRGMLKNPGSSFFTVTSGATLVQASHREAAFRLHNIRAVRIVALDAIHLALQYRVMLGKMKFRAGFLMALEAGFGIFTRIDDEFFETTAACHGDVLASRTVTGLATVLARHGGLLQSQPCVGT